MSGEAATVTNLGDAVKLATKYGAAASRHAARVKELTTTNGTLTDDNKKLAARVAELEKQLGTPGEKDQRITELEGQVLNFQHKGEFAKVAKAAGVRDDAVDDLYTALGYKAEGEPDPEKLKTAIEGAKASKAWAFSAPAGDDGKGGQQPPAKPIPGQGRGGANAGTDATIITAEQRADPKFMLDPSKQDMIQLAAKEGRFR